MKLDKYNEEFANCKNVSVSKDTDDRRDLTESFLSVIVDTPEYEQILISPFPIIPNSAHYDSDHSYWEGDGSKLFYEELINVINLYTPRGFYFGEHPDEKLNYGFWRE